jgi:hypothetical protein
MMVFGVVGDYHHPATGSDAIAAQAFHECEKDSAIELAVSRQNRNFPSRNRTAPKYPTLRRVGPSSKTGSLV